MKRTGNDPGGAEEPGFDAVLDRLRGVVERLESGALGLEASLAAYEEGVGLARRGHGLLDRAEQRVELLTAGAEKPVPFDEPRSDGDEVG